MTLYEAIWIHSEQLLLFKKKKRFEKKLCQIWNILKPQECIPVGCVPAAHWPYAGEGVLPSQGGASFLGGGEGVGRVVLPSEGGASFSGRPTSQHALRQTPGGGCFLPSMHWGRPAGVLPSQHALRQTPPVNRITDTSKNITLATTSLRPVKMCFRRFQATLISLPHPDPSSQFTKTLYPVIKFTLLCRYFTLLKCCDSFG